MDVGAAFVAYGQTPETVEPSDGALDDPPADAEATAMGRAAAREDREDPTGPQSVAMGLGVVAAVALERLGPPTRAAVTPAHGRERVHHRLEVGDVVDVGGGYLRDERDAARIGDEVVLGALLAAIGWVRSSFFPPRIARTDPLSITAQR